MKRELVRDIKNVFGHLFHKPTLSEQMTAMITEDGDVSMRESDINVVIKRMEEQDGLWTLQKSEKSDGSSFPLFIQQRLDGHMGE